MRRGRRALRRIAVALLCGGAAWVFAADACACGGPAQLDLSGRLMPISVGEVCAPISGYDTYYRDQLLFLYPFRLVGGAAYDPLWRDAYDRQWEDAQAVPEDAVVIERRADGRNDETRGIRRSWSFTDQPDLVSVTACDAMRERCHTWSRADAGWSVDTAPFDAAIRAHDWTAAAAAAEAIIARILDMPQQVAQQFNFALRRAVEFLELAPLRAQLDDRQAADYFLAWGTVLPFDVATLPPVFQRAAAIRDMARGDAARLLAEDPAQARAASLRFVLIQQALRQQIPNGWSFIPPEGAKRVDGLIAAWLADYPHHPLRELVQLQRVRLRYFEENGAPAAVAMLLDIYPRHPQRVLTDLRYIFYNRYAAVPVESLEQRQPFDPVLLTAMVPGQIQLGDGGWARLWRLSVTNIDAPWAVNLQERLLAAASRMPSLPEAYPSQPARPTELWGMLRLAEMAQRGRWQETLAQAALMPPSEEVAQIAAASHLALGQIDAALQVPQLSEDERAYLLETLLSDDELRGLLQTPSARAAALTLGIRRASAGDWTAAVDIVAPYDAARAARWREAASLAADRSPAGRLRWARYLDANRGVLFRPADTAWERSLGLVCARAGDQSAPQSSVVARWSNAFQCEAARRQMLESEAWLALQAYAEYLAGAPRSAASRTALRQANATYNWLINHCQNCWDFWPQFLAKQPAVATIRAAGERLNPQRARKG